MCIATPPFCCHRDKDKDRQESKRKVRPVGEAKKKTRFADEDDDGGKWETVPKRGTGQMTMQVGVARITYTMYTYIRVILLSLALFLLVSLVMHLTS